MKSFPILLRSDQTSEYGRSTLGEGSCDLAIRKSEGESETGYVQRIRVIRLTLARTKAATAVYLQYPF